MEFVDLASAPQKDAIAGVFVDMNNNTERLGLATWGGDDWVWSDEVDSQIREIDQPTGDFPAAVAWAGANGDTAICVYSDSQSATIDWYRWDGSAWKVGWTRPCRRS